MNYKISIILILIIVIIAEGAHGNPSIKQLFTQQYDNEGTKLDNCATCMRSSSPPSWNPYGTDLRNDPDFNRNNPAQALMNIEQLDSDADGFTNIDEIHNSTFPGDPDDFPAVPKVTQIPASTITEEQTVVATQIPTAARTDEKPMNSMFNALFTFVTIAVVSILVNRKKRHG